MKFDKVIWWFFKVNRNDLNRFDRKAEDKLREVFEAGKKAGRNECKKELKEDITNLLKKL